MTHAVTLLLLAASWRYRRGKRRRPCARSERGKSLRAFLSSVWTVPQSGVWGVGGGVWGEGWRDERRSFSQLPSPRAPKICVLPFLVTASPAIRSCLSLFYLSPSTHAPPWHPVHTCTPARRPRAAFFQNAPTITFSTRLYLNRGKMQTFTPTVCFLLRNTPLINLLHRD